MFKARLLLPTLFLMISFPVVNAVMFTPALPVIAGFFEISKPIVQHLMFYYLFGYAISQLIYAPLSNSLGRKNTLYLGIMIQVLSCVLCVAAGWLKIFPLFVVARFFQAAGSGVGLKMTFTLVNEYYEPITTPAKISYIMLGLAITPGIAIALGGLLNGQFGWQSSFYGCAIYGLLLFFLSTALPETLEPGKKQTFNLKRVIEKYSLQFNNSQLITSGILMGCANAFVYVFASVAPFLAINLLGLASVKYGLLCALPPIGLASGLICSARLSGYYQLIQIIFIGIILIIFGVVFLTLNLFLSYSLILTLFVPMMVVYFGIALVLPNASSIGMNGSHDRAFASALMNFINIGISTIVILLISFHTLHRYSLSMLYSVISFGMLLTAIRLDRCCKNISFRDPEITRECLE